MNSAPAEVSPVRSALVTLVVTGAAIAMFEWAPLAGLPPKVLAVLLVAAIGLAAASGGRALWRSAARKGFVAGLVLTSAVAGIFVLMEGTQPRNEVLLAAVGPTLIGWAIAAWLHGRPDDRGRDWAEWSVPPRALLLLLGAGFVLLTVTHVVAAGEYPVVSDEAVYVLQSDWFWNERYGWCLPSELAPHFLMRKVQLSPAGCLYGMYAPGWPAVLALFDLIGLRWWSGIIVGTGTIWATYRAGTLLYSRAAGLLAASLLAINPWFLLWHAGYMAHPLTMFSGVIAAVLLLEGERLEGRARLWCWLVAGTAIAVGVSARPLTGVALGASLGLWMLLRQRLTPAQLVQCAAVVILGALPIAAWFLHYNWATTGDPLRLSYQAMFGTGYNLGFGTDKGFSGFNETLERVPVPVTFTPRLAISNLLSRIAGFNFSVLPYALAAPVVALGMAAGHRLRWSVLLAFLILPALYFFYWYSDLRFSSELVPLFLVWVAAGIVVIARARRHLAASLLAAIACGSVLLSVPRRWERIPLDKPWLASAYANSVERKAMMRRLELTQRERGDLLVIVRERMALIDALIDRPYVFNGPGLESPILVVRDLGARNEDVIARFPDRTVVVVTDRGLRTPAGFEILER